MAKKLERDDRTLLALKAANKTAPQIAQEMGRTGTSVTSRLAYLKRRKKIARLLQEQNYVDTKVKAP